MHPADHYSANQQPVRPEGALDREPKVEATIASLKQHFEAVRQHEVKRVRGRLGELSCTQENAIESLSRGIIDQILNTPIAVLKASYGNSHFLIAIAMVHRIFNLGQGLIGSLAQRPRDFEAVDIR
jgi:glutamyl-tRNA reductase